MASPSALTAAIYSDYFAGSDMNVEGMSSHWQVYASKSSVRVDEQGVPVDAFGVGFGDMNARRPGQALFTWIAAALHAVRHPAKRHLLHGLRTTWRVTSRAKLVFNQDALRQALTLAFLARYLKQPLTRILMIGDGYGVLGASLAHYSPGAQIVFVDLGRSLLFQALTCSRAFPSSSHALVGRDDQEALERSRFVYCPADRLDGWRARPLDLAVNIASMQEMSTAVVARYFDLLRRAPAAWFYCCNRARKVMPGGEVSAFMDYPWTSGDVHVVDGLCPWHQWYVTPRRRRGAVPVSLVVPYDGPHLHRLTQLSARASTADCRLQTED